MFLKFFCSNIRRKGALLLVLATVLMSGLAQAQDSTFNPPFPRLAAGAIGGSLDSDLRLRTIAKHDVAVLGIWPGWNNGTYNTATLPAYIKSLNPDIKVANYTIVIEVNPEHYPEIHQKVSSEKGAGGKWDWYLRDANGNLVSSWPGAYRINHSNLVNPDANGLRYPQWYARYWRDTFASGPWDAIYSDVQNIKTLVTASWDGGQNRGELDPQAVQWNAEGHAAYEQAWAELNPNLMFFANMADQANPSLETPAVYVGLNEGGWFEGIMGMGWSPETWGGWQTMMQWYRKGMSLLKGPRIGMFHAIVTANSQGYDEYRFNRYALASCLMDDGYYMATPTLDYKDNRWYDEFDVDLGYPVDPPQTSAWSRGVYKRVFDNGLVLVNPRGNGTQTVDVGPGWRRFKGDQDPAQNNGESVTTLTLAEADGIILIREGGSNTVADPNPPTLGVE